MTGHDEMDQMLEMGRKIARAAGKVQTVFINGYMRIDAHVATIDGFTFKCASALGPEAKGADGYAVEIGYNRDPFVSCDGDELIRKHYTRYDAMTKIPTIYAQLGL